MRKAFVLAAAIAAAAASPGTAEAQANAAYMRVVDVGAGLCVVLVVPGGHAMLYDAGRGQPRCANAVRDLVPSGALDLVVLSHSDADHIRELPAILERSRAAIIVHPGDPRGSLLVPIRAAIDREGADVWNLAVRPLLPGHRFRVGEANVTFVAGWSDGSQVRTGDEDSLHGSHMHNALSIVMRVEYGGHSVLLTGDTVGREDYSPNTRCQYSERIMVERASRVPIDSDVLVGQHHGADNATSNCFIRAVSPTHVVFSAGHSYRHPRQSAVDRLVAHGVLPENIFRTDYGDNEGGRGRDREMVFGASADCRDGPGDDDVEILLASGAGSPTVRYRDGGRFC